MFLDVPAPVLHPTGGATAWIFFLVAFAFAVVLSCVWFARLRRTERRRDRIGTSRTASASPSLNQVEGQTREAEETHVLVDAQSGR